MAHISSVDWDAKLFYLHADTVNNGFSIIAAYKEVRALQAIDANNEQGYRLFVDLKGGDPKGGGNFTPVFGFLLSGWRGVPFGGVAHNLDLLDEIVSEDELSDRDVFDRTSLVVNVNIDPVYSPVEIRTVSSGSGLSTDQANTLNSIKVVVDAIKVVVDTIKSVVDWLFRWAKADEIKTPTTYKRRAIDDSEILVDKNYVDGGNGNESLTEP